MKAILCSQYCQPDDLVLADVPDPVAEPGQAVIAIKAAALNFFDILMIQGKYQIKPPFPFSPAAEVAGVIETVGEGVSDVKVGDRVIASCGHNGAREKIALPAGSIVKIPDNLDFDRAAGIIIIYGTALHALEDRASPKPGETLAVLDTLERDRCTVIPGVPTMLHALAQQDISGRDLSALRVAVSGGASLPEDAMRTFEGRYGITVLEGYGLSETASTCSFNRADDRRALSIGKPIWGVQMRVGDVNDMPLPPGRDHVGEILIRGHNVMKGYLGQPEVTATTLRGGWLHTGDLGYMDEDGFYFIVDRIKDLVIRGGYNVYPREVEEVLYAHPGILEAAVIGKPDERLGEEVVAVVVPRDGVELGAGEVIAYCRERLAAYKCPREVRFMAELPKGPTGKILKAALRGG